MPNYIALPVLLIPVLALSGCRPIPVGSTDEPAREQLAMAQSVVDEYYEGWTLLVNGEDGAVELIKHSATPEFRANLASSLASRTPPEPGGWKVAAQIETLDLIGNEYRTTACVRVWKAETADGITVRSLDDETLHPIDLVFEHNRLLVNEIGDDLGPCTAK